MTERTSPVTIIKQGHPNWVVLTSFFVGSWLGAMVAFALVIIDAN
jgi:hypothetical protein